MEQCLALETRRQLSKNVEGLCLWWVFKQHDKHSL